MTTLVPGQSDLIGPSRLKPTVPRKPAVGGPSTPLTVEPAVDGETINPGAAPWQNELVKRKNIPPTPAKKPLQSLMSNSKGAYAIRLCASLRLQGNVRGLIIRIRGNEYKCSASLSLEI